MNKIILKGYTNVCGITIPKIAGGFGLNEKSILAKDIATIHNKEVFHINELINNNRKRFKDSIDIIDLLGIGLSDTEIKEYGFTQQSINAYKGLKNKGKNAGIYLLSERGYSKLLKLLEGDLAWEKYDEILDGYFENKDNDFDNIIEQKISSYLLIAKKLAENTGIKEGIANATALEAIGKDIGLDTTAFQKLLPAAEHETGYITVKMISSKLNISSIKVNKKLSELGLQIKETYTRKSAKTGEDKKENQWRITDKGKEYGEEFPYNNHGHSGYQIRWNENVINLLQDTTA